METYELTFWLSIDAEPDAELGKVLTLITNRGGEIIEKFMPRRRRLAYPVAGQQLGNLATIFFKLNPETMAELKTDLVGMKPILRSIILNRKPEMLFPEKRIRNGRPVETGAEAQTEPVSVIA